MSRKSYEGRAARGQRPQTREQWQEAVDGAHVMLCLDNARLYGLITGGPVVNVARCQALLEQGATRRVEPTPDAIERWMKALLGDRADE